ncbi:helix-turn-helix domain-containing protein [Azospirillum formosense]|uniref:helix-turn-helix domain-containing protein n=1 Tax=Azospirillum formosense TaxID=861533 RepID=UPI003CCE8D04
MLKDAAPWTSPISADLRERVLLAYERHEGGPELLARRFQISRACAYNWVRAARLEGRRGRDGQPLRSQAGRYPRRF